MIIRQTPTYAVMSNLYDVVREVVKDEQAYYTEQEFEEMKQSKKIVILEGANNGNI